MKKVLKSILILLAAVLLAVCVYVAYVFLTYYRLEDKLMLEVSHGLSEEKNLPGPGEQYRVLSYNLGFGAYSDDYSFFMDGGRESRARSPEAVYENIGGALSVSRELRPDLMLFQEVDVDGTRSHHINQCDLIRNDFPEYDSVFAQNYDSPYLFWPLTEPHGANTAGQITLSEWPIASAIRRSLPVEGGFMKFLDLDRCYSVQRIPTSGGQELVVYNFHLSAYTSDGTIAEEQLQMLFEDMSAEVAAGNYTIAGGDFNKDVLGNSAEVFRTSGEVFTWAQPIPEKLVPAGLRIAAPFDEAAPVASCRNADRPYGPDDFLVTVDGFVLSDNVEPVECKVEDTGFRWSDHNPVRLDFILK